MLAPESHLRTTIKTHILYFRVLWRPGSHSTTFRYWLQQKNDLGIMKFCCHAQMCLWWASQAHVLVFTFFMNRKYVTPTMVGATSASCREKTDRRLYALMIKDAIATAGCSRHCLRNSRENQNKWVMSNNRSNFIKCDTWAIRLYETTSSMGRYFDYWWGFISSCEL